jgi:hypothetical protein
MTFITSVNILNITHNIKIFHKTTFQLKFAKEKTGIFNISFCQESYSKIYKYYIGFTHREGKKRLHIGVGFEHKFFDSKLDPICEWH